MWYCESKCHDRVEHKWTRRDPNDKEKRIEHLDVSWRARQGVPMSMMPKAPISRLSVLCAECVNAWNEFVFATHEFQKYLELDREIVRAEIEGQGKVLSDSWVSLKKDVADIAHEIVRIFDAWAKRRRDEVVKAQTEAGWNEVRDL